MILTSTILGLSGLTSPASAPCELVPGPLSVLTATGLPVEAIDWQGCTLDHRTLRWSWTFAAPVLPPPRVGHVYRFTYEGQSVAWAGILDTNLDGFVDGADYDLFMNAFELGTPLADYNADGFVDGMDVDAFNNEWEEAR